MCGSRELGRTIRQFQQLAVWLSRPPRRANQIPCGTKQSISLYRRDTELYWLRACEQSVFGLCSWMKTNCAPYYSWRGKNRLVSIRLIPMLTFGKDWASDIRRLSWSPSPMQYRRSELQNNTSGSHTNANHCWSGGKWGNLNWMRIVLIAEHLVHWCHMQMLLLTNIEWRKFASLKWIFLYNA